MYFLSFFQPLTYTAIPISLIAFLLLSANNFRKNSITGWAI